MNTPKRKWLLIEYAYVCAYLSRYLYKGWGRKRALSICELAWHSQTRLWSSPVQCEQFRTVPFSSMAMMGWRAITVRPTPLQNYVGMQTEAWIIFQPRKCLLLPISGDRIVAVSLLVRALASFSFRFVSALIMSTLSRQSSWEQDRSPPSSWYHQVPWHFWIIKQEFKKETRGSASKAAAVLSLSREVDLIMTNLSVSSNLGDVLSHWSCTSMALCLVL